MRAGPLVGEERPQGSREEMARVTGRKAERS